MNCCCFKKKEKIDKLKLYLRIIFVLNVALLLVMAPFAFFFPNDFEGKSSQVNLFLIITGSFWFAILICSFIGVFRPSYMEPIVIIQIIYKSLYSIYFAANLTYYKFQPYGGIFCFFLPWIVVIGVYLTLRAISIYKKKKSLEVIPTTEKSKEEIA
jgi:hypothetical protein